MKGRFRLVERAGRALWQAREVVDGVERAVAWRTFRPDGELRARLRRTVALGHANVVEVRDVGEADGEIYVARQWVAGCDWGRMLASSAMARMPLRLHLLVLIDVLRGLEHAAKLVDVDGRSVGQSHGRVTVTNVLVSFEGEVKLTDFGLVAGAAWAADGAAVAELLARAPSLPQGLAAIAGRARQAGYGGPTAMREDLEAFARREGILLSPAELGQLARDVISGASAPKAVAAPAAVARVIRPFDQALGMGLAALSDAGADAEAEAATLSVPAVSTAAPAARVPRTVALQPVIGTAPTLPQPVIAPSSPQPAPLPVATVDEIPRRPRWPLALLGGGASALFLALGLWAHFHHPPAPSMFAPPPVPVAGASLAPPPPVAAAPPVPIARAHVATHARPTLKAAHLSISADVPCDALVDGRFVGQTPLRDVELAPGRHVVRRESTMAGLRLIPREQTVELVAGESKPLTMVMQ